MQTKDARNFVPAGTYSLDISVDADTNLEDLAQHIAEYHTTRAISHNGRTLLSEPQIATLRSEWYAWGKP